MKKSLLAVVCSAFVFVVAPLSASAVVAIGPGVPGVDPGRGISLPSNLLLNQSFENAGFSTTTAYNWNPFGRGYTRVSSEKNMGAWSVSVGNASNGVNGLYQRVNLNQTTIKPVFIGGHVKGSGITMNPGSYFGAGIYVEIHLVTGRVVYWNSLANSGTFGWRWVGFNTGTLASVDAPIDHIFIVPVLGYSSGTAFFDDLSVREFVPGTGAVTFMFDDGEMNTYTKAFPILSAYNYKGSAAIVSGFVGTPGSMGKTELLALQNAGWEIVAHGQTHIDLTVGPLTTAALNMNLSKVDLTKLGLKVNNFAFPFGAYNANLISKGSSQYRSMRAYELGDNPLGTFPYEVKVRSVVKSTTLEEVRGWLANAIVNGRWEVLVFHTVAETGDDAYHLSPEDLSKIVDMVKASGLPVLTYNEGINRFALPSPYSFGVQAVLD